MNQNDALTQLEKDLNYLISTPTGRRLFLSSIPFLIAGCATPKSSRYREGNNKGQKTSISVNDEKNMTKEYLPQMKKDYPAYKDKFLQNYIDYLGQKIVKTNGLHNKPYKYNFTLVDTKAVNAFALPAGTVFVTGPLLAMAGSEAELAGVIGHEIGHVKARHAAERMELAKQEQTKTALAGLGGLLVGGALGYGIGKAVCKPKDKECLERAAKYGAIAGAAGGLLIQKYGFMANSREDEMEADRIGFRTSVKAGYNKMHVGKFYERLLKMEKQNKKGANKLLASFADAMSTHPPSEERVKQMRSMAKKSKQKKGMVSSKNFNKAKAIVKKLMKA